jgi:hypothetical protein
MPQTRFESTYQVPLGIIIAKETPSLPTHNVHNKGKKCKIIPLVNQLKPYTIERYGGVDVEIHIF